MKFSLPLLLAMSLVATSAFAQDADAPWPMVHHDRYNTGKASVGPSTYALPWIGAMILGSGVCGSPPSLGANGVGWISKWVNKSVYAFDWKTYAILGAYVPPAPQFCLSTPAIYNDQRIISLDNGSNNKIFAINPATMFHYWARAIGTTNGSDYERASPILGPDGDVVIGDNDGKLYRLDSITGTARWTASLSGISRQVCFTRDDQYVVVPNGNKISLLRYSDAQVIWSKDLGAQAAAPSTTASGLIVVGATNGTVTCLDTDGAIKWTYQTFGGIYDSPAVDGDEVCVASEDQYVYRLRATDGAILWGMVTNGPVRAAPIIGHDGRIYVVNRFTSVYCLNPSNGQVIWSRLINDDTRASMSIAPDGTLFVPTTGDRGMVMLKQSRPVVSGKVNFDLPSTSLKFPLPTVITLNNRGSQTAITSIEVPLGPDGLFEIPFDIPYVTSGTGAQGLFDITIKPRSHLRARYLVTLNDNGESGLVLNAINGDVNQNNKINTDDYLLLSAAFDASRGDAGFSESADLNGDDYVGTDDYLILNDNFDMVGQ